MFSCAAGLKLWRLRPGAIRFARSFLIGYLVANLAYLAFWAMLFHPRNPQLLAEMGWYHAVGPIAFTTLWQVYLEHSKRVKALYGTPTQISS